MVRMLVDVKGQEGEDAGDGGDECHQAGERDRIASAPSRRGVGGCGHRQQKRAVKGDHGLQGRQGGKVPREPLGIAGENSGATRRENVGLESEKILQLQRERRHQSRRHAQQQGVLDANQRIVRGLNVDVVYRQPHGGEEEHRHLGYQRWETIRIDVQGACRAHGADEHWRHLVGIENEKQQSQ